MPRFSDEQLRILAMDYGAKTSVPQLVQEIKDLREVVRPLVEALAPLDRDWVKGWLPGVEAVCTLSLPESIYHDLMAALAKAKSHLDLG